MADDPSTAPGKHHHGVSKFLKERWRSRSNGDETKKDYVMDQNVADFLKPTSSASARARPVAPAAPKIDIAAAQRWAGNSAELKSGNGMPTPSSMRGRGDGSQRKKPRQPNLTVSFSDVPDVIGEGGDECEDPTVTISRANTQRNEAAARRPSRDYENAPPPSDQLHSTRPTRTPPPGAQPPPIDSHDDDDLHPGYADQSNTSSDAAYRQLFGTNRDDSPPVNQQHDEFAHDEFADDDFAPKPVFKRAATGFHTRGSMSSLYSDEEGSADGSPATRRPAPTSNSYAVPDFTFEDSSLDFGFDKPTRVDSGELGKSPIELQNKINRMRREEGRVLHQNVRRSYIELAEDDVLVPKQQQPPTQPLPHPPPQPQATAPPPTQETFFDMYGSKYSPERSRSRSNQRSPEQERRLPPPPPPDSLPATLDREPRLPILPPSYQAPAAPVPTPSPMKDLPTPDTPPRQQALPIRKALPQNLMPRSAPAPLTSPQGALVRPSPSPLTIPGKDYFNNVRSSDTQSTLSYSSSFKTPATATSVKTPGSALSQVAFEDYGNRCSHMKGIFRLQAEFERPMSEYTPLQWLRAAAWWFVKGRMELEQTIRSRPKTPDGQTPPPQELLNQAHVDLAKCWWILMDVIPPIKSLPPAPGPENVFHARTAAAASSGDKKSAEFFESCQILTQNLRALISSMNKNRMMPPNNALIQGQDQTIWIPYPQFPPELLPILSGSTARSITTKTTTRTFDPLSVMAVADTKYDFTYYRWFVPVSLSTVDQEEEPVTILCLFSVMRTRNDWHPKMAICSQKELLTICVTGDRKLGPSWEDVKWSEADASFQIMLPHGYILNAQLKPSDYNSFVSMYKKAYTVQTSLFPLEDEHTAYEVQLADFQYTDTLRPPAFPMERMRRCRVRLLVKTETRQEGHGQRKFYRGTRILVTTSPKNRTLASASHELNIRHPLIMEMLTENIPSGESFPAMAIHIKEEHRDISLFMVFAQLRDRQMLYSAFNDVEVAQDETQYVALRLKKMMIEPAVDYLPNPPPNLLGRMTWQEVSIINKDPESPSNDFGQPIRSDSLRIISQGAGGTITDRVNVGPGELRIRIAPDGTNNIVLLRQPQDDLSMTFDRRVAPFTPEQVEELHKAIFDIPTKRSFAFYNATDLHAFQAAITGFSVKFDGLARSFTISRRRPVTALSKHKRLEAGLCRIQVISHDNDKLVQLLAFFESDFVHADALGFVLKSVDVFERYNDGKHGARSGVRIVDAKFSLPRSSDKGGSGSSGGSSSLSSRLSTSSRGAATQGNEVERPFVCLDMPEYPAENDDIWIGFDEEEEREKFLQALPAPATNHSRGMAGLLKR